MSKKSFARLTRIVTGTFGYGKEDGFSLETSLTKFEQFVHFWVLVWRSFVRNRGPVRASALSYTTLLALIPMLAVAMSVTSMFLKSEGSQRIEQFIQGFVDNIVPAGPVAGTNTAEIPMDEVFLSTNVFNFPSSASTSLIPDASPMNPPPVAPSEAGVIKVKKNVSKQAAAYIHQFVENTYSGTLGVTGLFFLLLTAILTLTRVEETFNDIWGVTVGRNWMARIVQYWAAITLGPLLIVAALGMAGGTHFQKTRGFINTVPYLEPLMSTYLPVVVICLTFALFYKLVPNTRVEFSAALVGGTLAGVAWHIYNQLGFLLASRAVSASAIYGRLALVPLLMGGLYMVWLTVLFGAQVAYAFQNRASYLQEKLAENVNQRGREFVALRLMTCIGQRFQRGLPPVTIREISSELGVPSRLAQQVLQTLLAARLVVEIVGAETGYSPARPLDTINCHHILLAMRATQGQELVTRDEPVRAEVIGEFARIQAAEKAAASTVTMLALVNRAHARLELVALTGSENESPPSPALAEARPPVELPGEKPLGEPLPEVNFAEPIEPVEPVAPKESKPVSPANISSAAPTAASATHDNESFPL